MVQVCALHPSCSLTDIVHLCYSFLSKMLKCFCLVNLLLSQWTKQIVLCKPFQKIPSTFMGLHGVYSRNAEHSKHGCAAGRRSMGR